MTSERNLLVGAVAVVTAVAGVGCTKTGGPVDTGGGTHENPPPPADTTHHSGGGDTTHTGGTTPGTKFATGASFVQLNADANGNANYFVANGAAGTVLELDNTGTLYRAELFNVSKLDSTVQHPSGIFYYPDNALNFTNADQMNHPTDTVGRPGVRITRTDGQNVTGNYKECDVYIGFVPSNTVGKGAIIIGGDFKQNLDLAGVEDKFAGAQLGFKSAHLPQ
jgi:hypothetical protein